MSKTKKNRGVVYALKKWWLGLSFPLFCKIHGVKNADSQGALVQSQRGDRLQIVHTPVQGFPYNVYVYAVELNRVMGYLDKDLSKKLVKLFGKGFCRDAIVENVTGGGVYKYRGCNIRLLESMMHMDGCDDLSTLRGE